MAVVVVGDFDTDLIEAKVKQHFAPAPEGEAVQERAGTAPSTDRPRVDIPGHNTPRVNVFTDPEAPGTQMILIRKVPPRNRPRRGGIPAYRGGKAWLHDVERATV